MMLSFLRYYVVQFSGHYSGKDIKKEIIMMLIWGEPLTIFVFPWPNYN